MNLPRIIIADENRPGKIPAGVLIATILKEMGYKLRLFMGNVDEPTLRTLQLMCNLPVTLIDPTLCERREALRWLFQEAASPDCLNIVLANLGSRWTEDTPFRVPRECKLLLEWLECEMIPVIYSDTSSVIAVRTLIEVMKQFEDVEDLRVHGILFRSVLNNREFELIDMEVGRQLTGMPIGSIPRSFERDMPLITDLCLPDNVAQALFPLRAAAKQLKLMEAQVKWPLFSALAQASPDWNRQPKLVSPIAEAGKINIAVIRDQALMLGGDGTEHLMKALGCNIVDIPLEGEISHKIPIHGVYVPHGFGYMTLKKFFSNLYVKTLMTRGSTGESFMLVEGGAAPLLGDRISLPYGNSGGGEGRGFSVLPFNSAYVSPTFGSPQKMVATGRKKKNPLLSGSQEWVWGYSSASLRITPESEDDMCWNLSENLQAKPSATDAVSKGRMLATAMRIEPWSTPGTFKRWLEG